MKERKEREFAAVLADQARHTVAPLVAISVVAIAPCVGGLISAGFLDHDDPAGGILTEVDSFAQNLAADAAAINPPIALSHG
jgi:hypothetical protein